MLKGAIAAAVTPLRDAGEALDEDAVGAYVEFLARSGIDGQLRRYAPVGNCALGPIQDEEYRGWRAHVTSIERRFPSSCTNRLALIRRVLPESH